MYFWISQNYFCFWFLISFYCGHNHTSYNFNSLNLLRIVLWLNIWKIFCVHWRGYILCSCWMKYSVAIRSSWFITLYRCIFDNVISLPSAYSFLIFSTKYGKFTIGLLRLSVIWLYSPFSHEVSNISKNIQVCH